MNEEKERDHTTTIVDSLKSFIYVLGGVLLLIVAGLGFLVIEMDGRVKLLEHQTAELLAFKYEVEERGSPILQATIKSLNETKAEVKAITTLWSQYLIEKEKPHQGNRPP